MAGVMVFGGASAVFADTAATTPTSTTTQSVGIFSDVKTGFWAEKHIYKLASQGIVVGNNGLFRPGDSVTQQEAVLMALRFMKLQDKVDASSAVALPTDFKVTNYYKDYVVLAFQQGLLDKATEMAPDNLKTSWGERKASREWIAELLIRSLEKAQMQQGPLVSQLAFRMIPKCLPTNVVTSTLPLIQAQPMDLTEIVLIRKAL